MEVKLEWDDLKTFVDDRSLHLQYIEFTGKYLLYAFDGGLHMTHKMYKTTPASSDQTDFETNYKPTANQVVDQKDKDGAIYTRPKTTDQGWRYEPRCLDFYTSKLSSLYNRKDNGGGILDGTDYGDAGLKFYDSTDTELVQGGAETDAAFQIRLDANCTKTIMWWQTTYDMDLIGGMLQLKAQPTGDTYFWCVVAPDIPEGSGGSIPFFASGLNLYFYKDGTMHHYDGRGAKRFIADPVYNSNKFHFILKHPVGEQVGLQIVIDTFKA